MIYKLPTGDYLLLPKYDKYYHMVEAVTDINGSNAKKVSLEFVYIMGQISNTVVIYKINLKNNEYLVTQSIKTIDDKFITGLNKQGWR